MLAPLRLTDVKLRLARQACTSEEV